MKYILAMMFLRWALLIIAGILMVRAFGYDAGIGVTMLVWLAYSRITAAIEGSFKGD